MNRTEELKQLAKDTVTFLNGVQNNTLNPIDILIIGMEIQRLSGVEWEEKQSIINKQVA